MFFRIASGTLFIATLSFGCGGVVADSKSSDSLQTSDGGTSVEAPATCAASSQANAGVVFASPKKSWIGALAADGENLYLLDEAGLEKIPLAGGSLTTLAPLTTVLRSDSARLVIDGSDIFFATDSAVGSVSISGGPATIYSSTVSADHALAVSSGAVFWVSGSSIQTAPRGGGRTDTIATENAEIGALAIDATNLYWHVDWPSNGSDPLLIRSIPLAGGSITSLGDSKSDTFAMVVAGNEILFNGINAIGALPTAGGSFTEIFRGYSSDGRDLVVNGDDVYWSGHPAGTSDFTSGLFRGSLRNHECDELVTDVAGAGVGAWTIGVKRMYWVQNSEILSAAK